MNEYLSYVKGTILILLHHHSRQLERDVDHLERHFVDRYSDTVESNYLSHF